MGDRMIAVDWIWLTRRREDAKEVCAAASRTYGGRGLALQTRFLGGTWFVKGARPGFLLRTIQPRRFVLS